MVSWICPNLPFRGSMLRNVQCTPCKIRTIICGNVLCESVKLTEPPDAEPHVRWCDRSAAKAVSYSILWKIKRNILSGFYTDPLVRRVKRKLIFLGLDNCFYTDPLVRRVGGSAAAGQSMLFLYRPARKAGRLPCQCWSITKSVSIQTRS